MHVKREYLKSFFFHEGEIVVQRKLKVKYKKNEFKKKEIKKTKDQAKTETKMNANRDAQKQKSDEKRMQETLDERKEENVFHERDSFLHQKKEEKRKIFSENTHEMKQTKGLFVRKNVWVEWKRMEKEEKRKIFPGKICEGEWWDVHTHLLDKKQLFFSARHNRIVKHVIIGVTIFQVFFFFEKFFKKKKK